MASLEAMGVSFQGTTMLRNEHKLVNTQVSTKLCTWQVIVTKGLPFLLLTLHLRNLALL